MRLHLVLCVSSILITLALRPHHEFETDLSALEQAQGPDRKRKEVPDLKSLLDAIVQDPHSAVHISTALMMVACAAFMLVSPSSFAWSKENEESKEKIIEDDSEAEEMEVQAEPTGAQMMPTEDKSKKGRWFDKAMKNIKVEGVLGGLSLQFKDVYTEKVWLQDSLPKNMQRGAFLMVGMAGGLFIQRMCFFLGYYLCGEPFEKWEGTGKIFEGFEATAVIPWYSDTGFSMCLLVVVAAAFGLTWMGNQPRQELSFSHAGSYWVLMFFLWFAFIATSTPPLKMTCQQEMTLRAEKSNSSQTVCHAIWTTPARRLDCSLQGHTACQIFMLFLLTLPFALPQLYHQPLCLVWLLIYVGATNYYGAVYTNDYDADHEEDLPLQLCLLLLAFIIGYSRKYYLEKSMRHQFVGQLRQRQAMAPLYCMFKELVPEYVIPRMLSKEVIADPRNTVTVLFVLINNFGEYTREKQDPKSSLKFLNACFDKMDAICAKYGVTKIETVAEEYVACVGVTKAEQEMDHKMLLTKLLKAAAEILALKEVEVEGGQTVAVEFKMGMHTGSIVAGVIGEKLPRFRLFGDTINTSARMMQKGQPGTLQFGEATMKYVNDDYVVDNSTRPNNGVVTMKGKGEVQTWVLKTSSLEAEEAGAREAGKRMSALSQMVLGMAVEETGDDEFDRMMDKQLAEDESEFSAKEEAQFRCWWHAKNGQSFGMRMNFLTFLLSCVTLAEILHMEHLRVWGTNFHASPTDILRVKGQLRFTLFLLFRFAAFLICMAWSILASSGSSWISPPIPDFTKAREWQEAEKKIRKVQFGLVTSKVLVSILMWLSYNVLVLQKKNVDYGELNFLEYMNQQFSLVFMVGFFVIINGQVISFASSLIFVLLAIVFMALEDRTPLYVSYTGRVVFVGVAALGSILAYEGERTSRARFRSKVKVERTESRIEDVLTTLMPEKVLTEWRANPGSHPVHEYKKATVTQSDLCGFTQLSSGRSPFEVVSFMGELFGRFDVLAQEHNIYKVETVGDAYIAGMAQPHLTDQHSAVNVVEFGLAMIKATAKWSERLRQRGNEYKDANVRCRVGVHHGECVGGIVGTGMMRYHLFGEFMSIVDILEATSKEGVCQISDACRMQIESEGGFSNSIKFEERKDELKTSKGEIHSTDEVGGTTYLVYPVITEDRVRNLEEDVSELKKKVKDLELRTSGEQDDL